MDKTVGLVIPTQIRIVSISRMPVVMSFGKFADKTLAELSSSPLSWICRLDPWSAFKFELGFERMYFILASIREKSQ